MAWVAPAALAVSAVSSVASGNAAAASGRAQQQQYEAEAQSARTAGMETSANLRREFGETLSTIRAMRGARNLGPDSPEAQAVEQSFEQDATRSRHIQESGYLDKAAQATYAGRIARFDGRNAQIAAYGKAGSSLLRAAGDVYAIS